MRKILSNIGSLFLLLILLINILMKSDIVYSAINNAFIIWKENLFPYLFPLFVISELLISFGFVELLGALGQNITKKLFKVKNETSYVFFMSLLTGFPSSAKYISQLYKNGNLNDQEATKILMFTHFSNPLFIIGTIATAFLHTPTLALLIFICHYIPNIIIGILFRNYYPLKEEKKSYSFLKNIQRIWQKPTKNFGALLGTAILNAVNTLLLILGTISIFLVITNILNSIINFGDIGNTIINGLIEMSQGLKYVSLLNISTHLKLTLSVIFISFGGFSVHLQIMSILSNTNVKYSLFLLSRMIHAFLSGIMAYILFPLFFN